MPEIQSSPSTSRSTPEPSRRNSSPGSPPDPAAPPAPPGSLREAVAFLPRPALPAVPARVVATAAAVAGVAVAVVVVFVAFRGPPATPEPLVLPRAVPGTAGGSDASGDSGSAGADGGAGDASSAGGRRSAGAYVHAAGAVARPGVYRVRSGGRVSDLLDAAGGPAADADLDQVNLAARVSDGERVYVPRKGEAPPPLAGPSGAGTAASGAGEASGGPINLNTATLEQLDSLPGVGPATAQAILDYRKTRGRFRSVDELMEVRGIGEAKLAAIRSKVRV